MKSPHLEPAFDYLAAVPRTRETTIHAKIKSSILDSIRNSDSEMPTLLFVQGPEGSGKTSLLNSINYSISNNLKGEYFPISLKLEYEGSEISKANLLRQIFDQVWESLIRKELATLDTPEYQDWISKLDSGAQVQNIPEFPLRSASILAFGINENSRDNQITPGLISTDWRSLGNIVRKSLPRFKNFILMVDNLETYRGSVVNSLMPMLTSFSGND